MVARLLQAQAAGGALAHGRRPGPPSTPHGVLVRDLAQAGVHRIAQRMEATWSSCRVCVLHRNRFLKNGQSIFNTHPAHPDMLTLKTQPCLIKRSAACSTCGPGACGKQIVTRAGDIILQWVHALAQQQFT